MQTKPAHVQLRLDNCLWCGKPLPDGRYDRKTHDACRVKLHRWKKRSVKNADAAIKLINGLDEHLSFDWEFCDAVDQVKRVSDAVNELYKRHNIVRVK